MADAVPAQVNSDPGPPRDTAKQVRVRPGMTDAAVEAAEVTRVSKRRKPKAFVPLANPERVSPEPGPKPSKKKAAKK